ncbi:MAG TPA: ArdC-like ssDNA-binding domain-containing protein [Gemmatimonadaceae bacterium]|nr:ArdC-like ssDNA-binding domain-containing protein [Gemmatimonadaceae bacterium]
MARGSSRHALSPEEREARRAEASARLLEAVQTLRDGEQFRAVLRFAARQRRYSISNTLLILSQRPDATCVMGFREWLKVGRYVKRGEQGIRIWVPRAVRPRSDDTSGDEVEFSTPATASSRPRIRFVIGTVFDAAQTDGEPLPSMPEPLPVTEEGPHVERLLSALIATARDDVVYAVEIRPPATERDVGEGWASRPPDCRIWVNSQLPGGQRASVLAHELAHAWCFRHDIAAGGSRSLHEIIAESTAFLVMDELGVDTTNASIPYVAGYAGDDASLLRGVTEAQTLARALIEQLRPRLLALQPSPTLTQVDGEARPAPVSAGRQGSRSAEITTAVAAAAIGGVTANPDQTRAAPCDDTALAGEVVHYA